MQRAPKGSYREEHVIKFLSRWLPAWTAERAAARDWRLLYLDAFAAHLTQRIRDLAFERGYVVLYHGGGTTGVCQVNDTDLHAAFEREYMDAECQSFFEQNLLDPGNIGRTRQQIIDDAVAVWRGLDHAEGVRGHKRTGLSNDLSGSEDHLVNRDARVFWDDLVFGPVRDAEVRRVQEAVAKGELSWCRTDIEGLFEPFPNEDVGAFSEGQEIEAPVDPQEDPCTDSDHEEDRLSDSDDDRESTRAGGALVPVDLPVEPTDTAEEVQEAIVVAERVQAMERIDAAAKASSLPAVQFHAQKEIRRLTKLGRSKEGKTTASAVLRRFVRKRRENEERRFRAMREESRKKNRARQAVKDAARKLKLAQEKRRAAAREKKDALAKLPMEFIAASLGQRHAGGGTRAHCLQREAALERVRLRAPPLPLEVEAIWDDFKKEYAKWFGARNKVQVGVRFVEVLRETTAALGDHLLAQDGSVVAPSSGLGPVGNPRAFEQFVLKAYKGLPKDASSIVI